MPATRALAGLMGFDADSPVAFDTARRFRNAGYSFALRYVARTPAQNPQDLTLGERSALHAAGLALMLVQHVALPGWIPTLALGTAYGEAAGQRSRALGVALGATLWCDLEGVKPGTAAADVIAYCNAWFDAVTALGFEPGLYVGDACGLSATQLYYHLKFARFWGAYNLNTDQRPAVRGVCLQQRAAKASDRPPGVSFNIDVDVVQADALGGLPMLDAPDEWP